MNRRGFSVPKLIITLVVLVALGSMATHTLFSWVPRNLQDVEGMSASDEEKEVPDLKERLKEAVEKSYEITITEEELNRYIASRLQLSQSSIVDDYVKIKGVFVDLKPGVIDVSIEREFGLPEEQASGDAGNVGFLPLSQTVSMQLEVQSVDNAEGGKTTSVHFPGGHFGQAPAPGLLVHVIKPSFDLIKERFAEEIDLGYNQMTSVSIEDGVIKLDPRPITIEQGRP